MVLTKIKIGPFCIQECILSLIWMGKSCDQRQIREDEPCIGISSPTQGREKQEDSQETIMWWCKVGKTWPFFDAVPVFLSF